MSAASTYMSQQERVSHPGVVCRNRSSSSFVVAMRQSSLHSSPYEGIIPWDHSTRFSHSFAALLLIYFMIPRISAVTFDCVIERRRVVHQLVETPSNRQTCRPKHGLLSSVWCLNTLYWNPRPPTCLLKQTNRCNRSLTVRLNYPRTVQINKVREPIYAMWPYKYCSYNEVSSRTRGHSEYTIILTQCSHVYPQLFMSSHYNSLRFSGGRVSQ